MSYAVQSTILVAVFAATTALAQLLGAANLGTAMGIGQLTFTAALLLLLLKR